MSIELSFEECMQKLEEVVRKLEAANLSLEAAAALYKEGCQLSALCYQKFNEAEKLIVKKIEGDQESDFPVE